jgi:hypothetical protein
VADELADHLRWRKPRHLFVPCSPVRAGNHNGEARVTSIRRGFS